MGVFQEIIAILIKLLEIRYLIIFNLILQSTLTLLAPLRKKIANSAATTFLWVAYTVAGLTSEYGLGLVTSASVGAEQPKPLVSFWAPFIFSQVVGPDTITAFSIEDTKSCFRTSCRLFLSSAIANRAMIILLPTTRMAVAAFLIYYAALLKLFESLQSLFFGNLTRFKTFTKPIFSRLGDARQGSVHARVTPPDGSKLGDADVVRDAYGFFQTFKGVFANIVFSSKQRSHSCDYFLSRDAEDAFAVVETELNFAYDILYTKTLVVRMRLKYVSSLMGVLSPFVAFFVWLSVDKHGFDKLDVGITYTLVLWAITFDVISLSMALLSNWSVGIVLQRNEEERFRFRLIHKFLSLKKKLLCTAGMFSQRWSKSVSRYSLIMCCTSKSSPKVEKILGWFKIKNLVYNSRNMSPTRFDDKLRDFLFNQLKYRSLKAQQLQVAKQMSSARGDWILLEYYHDNPVVLRFADTWFVESMEFDKIVLLWHAATELCYHSYISNVDDQEEKERREFSKVISNYLVYLIIREQTMLSGVAGEAKATFQHTCDEVVKMLITIEADLKGITDKEKKVEKACRMIIQMDLDQVVVDCQPNGSNEERKKSILEDARLLSKELKGMMEQGIDMWGVMSKVWVELLCYAASNCKASEHAAHLSKGGQLLTLLWLLMAHLGLSNRFPSSI